jgi:AcrR family transcriptional regulator
LDRQIESGNRLNQREKQLDSPFNKSFLREQKRRAILSEAARLFNVHGARATRLSDVAEALDLNKASLYYYIKSKDDLIYQTYEASCDSLEALLKRADTLGKTGSEKLVWFVRSYFEAWQAIMLGERPQFATLTEIRALKPVHRSHLAARYRALFGRIKKFIQLGIQDNSLRPCQETDAALAIFGLVQLTVLWLPGLDPADTDRAADDFIDIILHGIAADGSAGMQIPANESGLRNDGEPDLLRSSRREAFCRVGSAYFNRKGFKATFLDDIADELAVTKGAFYYSVKDKDDLLHQCFERSLALMTDTQERAGTRGGSGLEELQRCVFQLFDVQTGDAGPLIRFNLIPSLSAAHKNKILAGIERVSDGFGALIEKGIADGSIRRIDPYIAEQMLMTAIDLSAELPWMRDIGDVAEACQSYFAFYFSGLSGTTA